jgi:RHS repeat-associated protein
MPDPIMYDYQALQVAFQTVKQFGEQVNKLGTAMTNVHNMLEEHCSGDESGVGAVIASAAKDVTGVAGKVFTEGGRVLAEMGSRGQTNGQRAQLTDETIAGALNGVHDNNYGGGTSGGDGSDPGGGDGSTGTDGGTDTAGGDQNGEGQPGSSEGNGGKCTGGDPVDVVSGQMITWKTDLELPGLLPLILRRSYGSGYRSGRLFGPGWSSTLDQRITIDGNGIHFVVDDAQVLHYAPPAYPGERVLPANGARWPLTWDRGNDEICVEDPDRGCAWRFPKGPIRGRDCEVRPLAAVSDRNGRRIVFLHDEDGIPTEVRYGGYRVAVDAVATSAGFRIEQLRLLSGTHGGQVVPVVRYTYDPWGRLTGITDSSGVPYVYEYDDANRITAWIDRNGYEYRYEYDESGRVVRGIGPRGCLSARFAYDDGVTTVTDSLGHATAYHYDEYGHVTKIVDPVGSEILTEYDRYGHLLSRTDELGGVTRFTRDESARPTRIEMPDATAFEFSYGGLNQPVSVRGPAGTAWQYTHDEHGNVTSAADPSGAVTTFAYTDSGSLRETVDALGQVTRYETDATGQPVSVTDPLGNVTRIAYDAFGRAASVTDPVGGVLRTEWSVEGKVLWQEAEDGAREEWTYDPGGNLIEHRDPNGGVTTFEHGPFGKTISRTDPTGARHGFSYDTELRLTRVTGPTGLDWRYEYDAGGRLVQETDFNGRILAYRRDAAGRVAEHVNGAGQTTTYVRDRMGRVVERCAGEVTYRYVFDRAGRLARAVGADCAVEYTRDALGRVLTETVDGRTVSSEYDALGRRVRRVTSTGAVSQWTFDAAGLPQSLATLGGGLSFQHDAAGRETTRFLGHGAALSQSWDTAHRLTGQAVWAYAGAEANAADYQRVQERSYAYRADGLPVRIEDHLRGARRFDLTADGRVAAVHATGWSESYTYDGLGNLVHSSAPEADGTNGEREHHGTLIRRAGRTEYERDGQGRVLRSTRRTLSGQIKIWTYSWDADDHLAEAVTPDGTRWRYRYDPLGRRVAKECTAADNTPARAAVFTWDGMQLAEQAETLVGRTTCVTWEWEPGGFRAAAQSRRSWADDAPQELIDSEFHAVITDAIGTPSELVTPDGRIAWYQTRSLWGGLITAPQSDTQCPLRFPGQYHDTETGLDYNIHRYYDPDTGVYTTPDPLGLAPSPNHHAYVDNPLAMIDPLGLAATPPGRKYVNVPPGGNPTSAQVPDLTGMTQTQADALLSQQGFQLTAISSDYATYRGTDRSTVTIRLSDGRVTRTADVDAGPNAKNWAQRFGPDGNETDSHNTGENLSCGN